MEGIRFFGAIDRKGKTKDGAIASYMPGWFNDRSVDALKENVESEERRIKLGAIPHDEVHEVRQRISLERERYQNIENSVPKLRGGDKDKVAAHTKELGKLIGESMFTDSDMRRGTASPHMEADRMTRPIIRVNPKVAEACGVAVGKNGMVSRNGAIKIWQLGQKLLQENTNAEILRRA